MDRLPQGLEVDINQILRSDSFNTDETNVSTVGGSIRWMMIRECDFYFRQPFAKLSLRWRKKPGSPYNSCNFSESIKDGVVMIDRIMKGGAEFTIGTDKYLGQKNSCYRQQSGQIWSGNPPRSSAKITSRAKKRDN